jgi:hypothetical protein
MEEFALLALVRQHLRPGAGRRDPVRYRSLEPIEDEARLVLSVLAHAGARQGDDPDAAFARGASALGLEGRLVPLGAIEFARVGEALARLRLLAPFRKGELLAACVATAVADEEITVLEGEVLRAVAAALDCPVPPILGVRADGGGASAAGSGG